MGVTRKEKTKRGVISAQDSPFGRDREGAGQDRTALPFGQCHLGPGRITSGRAEKTRSLARPPAPEEPPPSATRY